MQHSQIHLGQAVLSRHISCTLSQAASPFCSPVCCWGDWDKFRQGPDPVKDLRASLENDVLQPFLALDVSLQVEDASVPSQPASERVPPAIIKSSRLLQMTSSSVQAEGCNLFPRETHGKLLGANGFVQVILEV